MKRLIFPSIFFRVVFTIIFIGILNIIFFLIITMKIGNNVIDNNIENFSMSVAMNLRESIVNYMSNDKIDVLNHYLSKISRNKQVNFLRIISTDYRIFAATEVSEVGEIDKSPEIMTLMDNSEIPYIYKKISRSNVVVYLWLYDESAEEKKEDNLTGILQVGVDTAHIRLNFSNFGLEYYIHNISYIVIVIFSVIVTLILFIFRPLKEFQNAIDHIINGDYAYRLPVKTLNEIGELNIRFNIMAQDIDKKNKELRDNSQNLENEINIKTTELQQANSDLKETLMNLEHTHVKLLQADKMASIGQLSAGIAHEINNPVGFVKSNLHTLQNYIKKIFSVIYITKQSESMKKFIIENKIDYIMDDIEPLVKESLDGIKQIEKIVNNLRSFSHIDKQEIVSGDINEMLENIITLLWNEIKYKARVVKKFETLPLLSCNIQQIGQVFLNVIINAVHAIKENGIIEIKTEEDDKSIIVRIEDNGCGIPSNILSRIFDPFFTTKDVGSGTGLGLSISYDIIKAHKGTITIDSEVGLGTSVTITLPKDASSA